MKLFKKTELKSECMTGATDGPLSQLDICSFFFFFKERVREGKKEWSSRRFVFVFF